VLVFLDFDALAEVDAVDDKGFFRVEEKHFVVHELLQYFLGLVLHDLVLIKSADVCRAFGHDHAFDRRAASVRTLGYALAVYSERV